MGLVITAITVGLLFIVMGSVVIETTSGIFGLILGLILLSIGLVLFDYEKDQYYKLRVPNLEQYIESYDEEIRLKEMELKELKNKNIAEEK